MFTILIYLKTIMTTHHTFRDRNNKSSIFILRIRKTNIETLSSELLKSEVYNLLKVNKFVVFNENFPFLTFLTSIPEALVRMTLYLITFLRGY